MSNPVLIKPESTAGDLLAMFLVIMCFLAVAVVGVVISMSDSAKWEQRDQIRQQYIPASAVVQTVQLR